MSVHQLLRFEAKANAFVLPARMAREAVRAVAIAALPEAPPIVEGPEDSARLSEPPCNPPDSKGPP
jgi:hypothetical protein